MTRSKGLRTGFYLGRGNPDFANRFWEKVQRNSKSECWIWLGAVASGYGYVSSTPWDKAMGAHRVAYFLANGPVFDNILIRHTCDNKLCVNPNHLIPGTKSDNSRDMVERTYNPRKLSDDQVRLIRSGSIPFSKLARLFGVSEITIYKALSGEHYQSVT